MFGANVVTFKDVNGFSTYLTLLLSNTNHRLARVTILITYFEDVKQHQFLRLKKDETTEILHEYENELFYDIYIHSMNFNWLNCLENG